MWGFLYCALAGLPPGPLSGCAQPAAVGVPGWVPVVRFRGPGRVDGLLVLNCEARVCMGEARLLRAEWWGRAGDSGTGKEMLHPSGRGSQLKKR